MSILCIYLIGYVANNQQLSVLRLNAGDILDLLLPPHFNEFFIAGIYSWERISHVMSVYTISAHQRVEM